MWSATTRAVPGSVIFSLAGTPPAVPEPRSPQRASQRQLEQTEGRRREVLCRPPAVRSATVKPAPRVSGVRRVTGDRVCESSRTKQVRADRRLAGLLGQRVALVCMAHGGCHVAPHAVDLRGEHEHVGKRPLVAHLHGPLTQQLEGIARAVEVVPPQPGARHLKERLCRCTGVFAAGLERQRGLQCRCGAGAPECRLGEKATAEGFRGDTREPPRRSAVEAASPCWIASSSRSRSRKSIAQRLLFAAATSSTSPSASCSASRSSASAVRRSSSYPRTSASQISA